jgi:hypothetical protein
VLSTAILMIGAAQTRRADGIDSAPAAEQRY